MKWNFTEFKTYVLLKAAHSDMDFSEEERLLVQNKLNPDTYLKIYNEFLEDTDFQRIEKIKDASLYYCDTADKKQELLDKVRELFEADGEYGVMEHNLMLYLKKLI